MGRRRPLAIVTLAWILGIGFSHQFILENQAQFLLALLSAALVVTLVLLKAGRATWLWGLILLIAGLGALRELQTRLPLDELYAIVENLEEVEGLIVEYPTVKEGRTSFLIQPDRLPGRLQVFYYHPQGAFENLHFGDRVSLSLPWKIPWSDETFNYQEYLLSRGIWAIGTTWTAREITIIGRHEEHPLLQWGYKTRNHLFALIDAHFTEPASALMKSLLLGDRSNLDEQIEEDFRDAGVMHILAVSGMHLGILVALFWGLFRLAGLSFTKAYLVLIPLILIYLLLVGFKVSLVRAALMFAFAALGWLFSERGWILKDWIDPLQGLCLAALLILITTPSALYDVSFQLSFMATAGILIALGITMPIAQSWRERLLFYWGERFRRAKRIFIGALEMMIIFCLISLAAQIAVSPVLGVQFHRVYLASLLANLVAVPLSTLAMWLGVPFLLAALLSISSVSILVAGIETWLISLLISTTGYFAALPGAYLDLDTSTVMMLGALFPLILSNISYLRIIWWKAEFQFSGRVFS